MFSKIEENREPKKKKKTKERAAPEDNYTLRAFLETRVDGGVKRVTSTVQQTFQTTPRASLDPPSLPIDKTHKPFTKRADT